MMVQEKECIVCKKKFETSDGRIKICSNKCRKNYKEYYKRKITSHLNGIENVDYIVCKWCGEKVKRIYGKHLKISHIGKTSNDYKKEFLGSLLTCEKDKDNTSKNSGKFMKEEKWRKWASNKMIGEKNINHSSKVNEQQRKESSPFSKEFYKKRGLSEENRKKFIENSLKDREFEMKEDYWLKRGYSEEETIQKIKERQTTFSLYKCIKKYGEEKGLERWKQRQEKWLKNYPFNNYSKISQILFKQLYNKIKNDFKEIYYAECIDNNKNNEYRLKLADRIILPDFFVKDNNKIIEFDGVYWHKTTPENKTRETEKDLSIINSGYDILHIREDYFIKDPEKEIKKCIDFIYEK